jgi:hypothetical protein
VGAALLLAAAAPVAAHASTIIYGGTYVAAPGELNQITIDKHPNDFTYTDLGAASIDPGDSSCNVAGNQVTCAWFSDAVAFNVFAGDQDDTITDTQGGHPFMLDGGPGDDQITASEYLPANGGPGNDHMVGGPAADWFYGGSRGTSADLPDNDRMEGLGGGDGLYGQIGDDVIDGGEGDDHIEGGDGNDVVHGGPGNDFVDGLAHTFGTPGDAGSDVLDGAEGDDSLVGAHDNGAPDTFACGPGSDVAEVGAGDQVQSDCEEVDELVGCPAGGGCTVALVVSAIAPSGRGASAAASKRHGRRVLLGTETTGVGKGARKQLRVRLNRGGLKRVLRGDGKTNALIEVKLLKKNKKPKRLDRTPFGLRR